MLIQCDERERNGHLIDIYKAIKIIPSWKRDIAEAGWPEDWIEFMEDLESMEKQGILK